MIDGPGLGREMGGNGSDGCGDRFLSEGHNVLRLDDGDGHTTLRRQ